METGIKQRIEAHDGSGQSIAFNDWDVFDTEGVLQIKKITGADGADVRAPVSLRAQASGPIFHPFYRGARYFTLQGIIVGPTAAARETLSRRLKAVVERCMLLDGKYVFEPSNATGAGDLRERFINCRHYDKVEIDDVDSSTKSFVVPLVGDSLILGAHETTTEVFGAADFDPDLVVTITNAGDGISWPVLRVNGPVTFIIAQNLTLNMDVSFGLISNPTMSIADDHLLEITNRDEKAYLDQNQADYLRFLDVQQTNFWPLAVGDNDVCLISDAPSMDVLSNDGYS